MGKLIITKMLDTAFQFEYEGSREKATEAISPIKRFKYEDRYYKVIKIDEVFSGMDYQSFIVRTKPEPKIVTRLKRRISRHKKP